MDTYNAALTTLAKGFWSKSKNFSFENSFFLKLLLWARRMNFWRYQTLFFSNISTPKSCWKSTTGHVEKNSQNTSFCSILYWLCCEQGFSNFRVSLFFLEIFKHFFLKTFHTFVGIKNRRAASLFLWRVSLNLNSDSAKLIESAEIRGISGTHVYVATKL